MQIPDQSKPKKISEGQQPENLCSFNISGDLSVSITGGENQIHKGRELLLMWLIKIIDLYHYLKSRIKVNKFFKLSSQFNVVSYVSLQVFQPIKSQYHPKFKRSA